LRRACRPLPPSRKATHSNAQHTGASNEHGFHVDIV
jgi:hypothetical protein